jgi:hypothetical protein
VTVTPLPAVSVPWQEAQVPWPGAPVLPSGGLVPNEYMIAGTDMSATIVVANIAVLRPLVTDRIAPLTNIIRLLLVFKHAFGFLSNTPLFCVSGANSYLSMSNVLRQRGTCRAVCTSVELAVQRFYMMGDFPTPKNRGCGVKLH